MFGKLKRRSHIDALLQQEPTELARQLGADPGLIDEIGPTIDKQTISRLNQHAQNSPLANDAQLWLRYAKYTIRQGVLPWTRKRPPAAEIYSVLRPEFDAIRDLELAVRVGGLMLHQELSSDEIRSVVRHCFDLSVKSGQQPPYGWNNLLFSIQDRVVLHELLAIDQPQLRAVVIGLFAKLNGRDGSWEDLYDFAKSDPVAIKNANPRLAGDTQLWRILWQSTDEECRDWALARVCAYFDRCSGKDISEATQLFREMLDGDEERVLQHLDNLYIKGWRSLSGEVGPRALWEQHFPAIDPWLVALIAETNRSLSEAEQALVREILGLLPDSLANVPLDRLISVISSLDERLWLDTKEILQPLIAKSSSQSLRQAVAEAFRSHRPDLLAELGWLDVKAKNMRQTCLEVLLQHPDSGAVDHLREMAAGKGMDQTGRDRILDHLETQGVDISDLDEMGDDAIGFANAQAAKSKRVSKVVEQACSETLAKTLPRLSSESVLWLMQQMASNKEPQMARSVRKVFAACSEQERIAFAGMLLGQWIASDGDPKLAWMLKALDVGGDDRQVSPLRDAISAWHKKRKPRAVRAVQALAQIGTTFALSQVKVVAETRRNPNMLVEAARETLQQAAKHKGISVSALYDELVPDFGLGDEEGLALDVGPYAYRLKLQGDLSFRVVGPTGKTTKTLPKLKADEDPQLHAAADALFKQLRKDLKKIAQQQIKRLPALLMGVRSWSAPTWRRLFVDHPVFRTLAQSLVWSRRDSGDKVLGSFRLAEDLSLIDHQDDIVELQDDDSVTLWHPIDEPADVTEAWREHLENYKLTPILEQVSLPVHRWQDDWLKTERRVKYVKGEMVDVERPILAPFQGYALTMSQLKRLMNRWGYRAGSTEDGGNIYQHYLPLEDAQLCVWLWHSAMPAWFDENHKMCIQSIAVHATGEDSQQRYDVKGGAVNPKLLPSTMLSMLYAQLEELATNGTGYRKDWEKMY